MRIIKYPLNPELDLLWVQMQRWDMTSFLQIAKVQAYAAGEKLFSFEDDPQRLYFVQHGQVRTFTLAENRQPEIKQVHNPGDIFGCTFADMGEHDLLAEAVGDVVICSVNAVGFKRLMQACPDTGIGIFRYVAQKRNEQVAQLNQMLQSSAFQRVIWALLIFGQRLGFGRTERFTLYPYFTHGDIAQLAGLQRTTVSEIISKLRSKGIIIGKGRQFDILHSKALQALEE